jgi:hypothetical protein
MLYNDFQKQCIEGKFEIMEKKLIEKNLKLMSFEVFGNRKKTKDLK